MSDFLQTLSVPDIFSSVSFGGVVEEINNVPCSRHHIGGVGGRLNTTECCCYMFFGGIIVRMGQRSYLFSASFGHDSAILFVALQSI